MSEAMSMAMGPLSASPKFQPKYIPAMTPPTPSAQMSRTRKGFFSACCST